MSRNLSFGIASGPDIGAVQDLLNKHNPTRLPRLPTDNTYGVFTMARVMEFQHQKGLDTDGVCGRHTRDKLAAGAASPAAPNGRCIVVDLISQNRAHAFLNGAAVISNIPCHGGSATDATTRGVFSIDSARRFRHHTSAEFPIPPDNMQFALFFHGGEALHLGPPDLPSHGCVHVGLPGAEQLFNFAGAHDVMVIIVKRHKK